RVVVHTIGIGDPAASGEDRVDFDALRDIARIAGGRFFRARDQASLQEVYATLDRITPHEVRTLRHQPKREDFWMPLGAALAVSLPSVSRISILSRSPAWSSMRMPRPMASPSAVLGPAMPTAVRCS
ncbi:hypothetical protein OMF49_21305, partial [Bordetella pertussis]